MITYRLNRARYPRMTPSEVASLPRELKYEFTLDIDNYEEILAEAGVLAYARLLINLLFLKPGTYPNSPDMGIDINKYSFELMDEELTSQLEDEIKHQVSIYLPNNVSYSIRAEHIQPPDSVKKVLGIGFSVNEIDGSLSEFFLFMKEENGKKVTQVVVP